MDEKLAECWVDWMVVNWVATMVARMADGLAECLAAKLVDLMDDLLVVGWVGSSVWPRVDLSVSVWVECWVASWVDCWAVLMADTWVVK